MVVPVRTVQEAIAAGDLPPLDVDAADVFSQSERILQEHVRKHGTNAAELQDLIQRVWAAASDTFGQQLQIPPKSNLEWTAGELNAILENNLVPSHNGKGQLLTFGCIQWECALYSGRPKARCYPFNMKGLLFRGKNCQVLHDMISYMISLVCYDIICEIVYDFLL